MANSLLNLFREDPREAIRYSQAYTDSLVEETAELRERVVDLEENLLAISDAFDNVGWSPLGEDEAKEIPLKTVKKISEVSRALYSMNPFVKRGVEARHSYVWGRGVQFDGTSGIDEQIKNNRKKLFSPQAYQELEVALATDGNVFTALQIDDSQGATAFRIPITQITGSVSNPDDAEEIWFYKREYSVQTTNSRTGRENKKQVIEYIASIQYYKTHNQALPINWNRIKIRQDVLMQHTAVNKQVGWRWGLPDITPVIFWAKAYKEYLEDNATLVKAYSRIAWQIKAGSAVGAQAAAMQVMTPPSRDPLTGERRDVGGTMIGGSGNTMTALPATGSQVDFSKGSALASAIASGLEVSKVVITSDPGEGNRATAETLDQPTLKAMESRQLIHTERFLEIFEFWGADIYDSSANNAKDVQEAKADNGGKSGPNHVIVTWPHISPDTTKDYIASLGTAVELGIIYKQEARKEALDTFGIAPYKAWDDLPTMEDDPAAQEKFDQQQEQFQQQQDAQAKLAAAGGGSVIPGQGKSGGVAAKGGALSTNNQARDSRNANSKSK